MYTLLIVEDEPIVRQGLVKLIDYDRLGITRILEASNGQEALEIVQKERLDIMLVDINMPQVDGLTFAKEAKRQWPEARLIFITGYDYFEYVLAALKLGADDYLLKPVSKKDIEQLLVRLIGEIKKVKLRTRLHQLTTGETEMLTPLGERLKKMIDQDISNPQLSLSWLARKMSFNPSYLSGLIKREIGISFQDYVVQERIKQAKVRLLTTELKNYEIAEELGFEDASYFAQRFKNITGKTPKQYKRESEDVDDD